jgi:hypothetical protein
MTKNTKYLLGAGAVAALYLIWKRRHAAPTATAQVAATAVKAVTPAPATTLSGTSLDGHVLHSYGHGSLGY